MPTRIQICHPCALGTCASCIHPAVDDDGCICRHTKAPRAALRSSPALPDHAQPSARDFDLDTALAEARDAGRQEGYRDGFVNGTYEGRVAFAADLEQLAAVMPQPVAGELLELDRSAWLVLLELDANGGIVGVVDAGPIDALAEAAASYEPPLPGSYVEAWPVGGAEPIVLPAAS